MMSIVRIVGFLFGLSLLAAQAHAQAPDLASMDVVMRSLPAGPVALVDNEPIPRDTFVDLYTSQIQALEQHTGGAISDADRVKAGIACLSELTQQLYLRQEATRRGIKVTDAETAKAYSDEIKAAQDAAAAQGLPTPTEEQLLENSGQTREEALSAIGKALVLRKTVDEIVKDQKITVSDADVKAYFDKNQQNLQSPAGLHLKQILIKPGPVARKASEEDWAAARKRMDQALARIRAGQTFEAVAKDVSEAPDAASGGDMGLQPVSEGKSGLPPFFIEAAKTLKPGDISDIFRSEYGWHLIKLVERSEGSSITFEKAAPLIKQRMLAMQTEYALDATIKAVLDDPGRVRVFMELPRALMESLDTAKQQP